MALQVWCEVYDASDALLGIVPLRSATVSVGLDEAGSVTIAPLFGEEQATTLLQVQRKVKVYWQHPLKGKTLVATAIVLQQAGDIMPEGDLPWSGLDEMEELRRANTLRGLTYNDQAIPTVIEDLLDNASGWSLKSASGLGNTSRRFDTLSILEAVRTVAIGAGLHFRRISSRRLEVGAFGDDSRLMATNLPEGSYEALHRSDLLILRNPLNLIQDGARIVNWIEPVWGGGDAVLTLKRSTRTSPYPIQTTTGPNGKTIYYLSHTASIALYGTIQGPAQMADQPYIAADATVLINAANVLYDWSAASLTRTAYPQTSYSLTGIKLDRPLLPGQTIRLVYKGWVTHYGRRVRYAEIDADFWVLRISESYDESGQGWAVDVSTVDAPIQTDNDLLAGVIMQLHNQAISQKLSASPNRYSEDGTVNANTPLEIEFTIANTTVDIGEAILTVTRADSTGPFGVYVTVDGTQVGDIEMIDGSADDSFELDIGGEDGLTADMDALQGDHTVAINALARSGTVTAALEIVEIGLSVD